MALTNCKECGQQVSDQAAACPHCGYRITPPEAQQDVPRTSAAIRKAGSFAGGGCALQALGLLSLLAALGTIMTIVGPIVFGILGFWLIYYGSKKASWHECSACGGRLANARVSVCQHCRAELYRTG